MPTIDLVNTSLNCWKLDQLLVPSPLINLNLISLTDVIRSEDVIFKLTVGVLVKSIAAPALSTISIPANGAVVSTIAKSWALIVTGYDSLIFPTLSTT